MPRKFGFLCAVGLVIVLVLTGFAVLLTAVDVSKVAQLTPLAVQPPTSDEENNTSLEEPPTTSVAGPLNPYYNSTGIQIPFQVSDNGMGFSYVELYYRLHGDPWARYTTASEPEGRFTDSPIDFRASEDGQYDFYTLAMDDTGNLENDSGAADVSTVVDTVAPDSTIFTSGDHGSDNWFNSSVTVSFKAEDNGSGVGQTFYRVNNGGWTPYSENIVLSDEGNYSIDYYSVDKAGNAESVRSAAFNIDLTAPQLSFKTEDGAVFTSSNVMIVWSMNDSQSNISVVELSVDGGDFTFLGAGAYLCTISDLSNGTHSITLRIRDEAGNSVQKNLSFAVDIASQAPPQDLSVNPLYALVLGAVAVVGVAFILRPAIRRGKGSKKEP